MTRRFFLTLFLIILSCPLHAEEMGQAIIGPGDILRGRFIEERVVEGFRGTMRSEGHFVVAPAEGVIWAVEKPFSTTTVITPAGLAQLIGGMRIMHLPAQKIPFMLHLYEALGGALTGDWHALESDFVITRSDDGKGWRVGMIPRRANNPAMPFSSIVIKGHHFVEEVEMIRTEGGSDTINFLHEVRVHASPTAGEETDFSAVSQ